MTKERKARRERRAVYRALCHNDLTRRPPTALEVATLFRAIDQKDFNALGVRLLVELELDGLYPMPEMHTAPGSHNEAGFERNVTLLGYAAWRRRAGAVKSLLVAGARATVSERSPQGALHDSPEDASRLENLLSNRHGGSTGLDSATAVHVVECVGRMRTVAARDVALGANTLPCAACGKGSQSVCFDPCGCVCCEECVWRSVLSVADSAGVEGRADASTVAVRGEVRCPVCHTACMSRGYGEEEERPIWMERSGIASSANATAPSAGVAPSAAVSGEVGATAAAGFGSWACECCHCGPASP